jgi:ADP-ribose pyrophosphatase YjhB (NUDIX family)
MKIATLVYITRLNSKTKQKEVLLAKKTRKTGAEKWNGYGGGVEEGETVVQCAIRETREESGGNNYLSDKFPYSSMITLNTPYLVKRAIFTFRNADTGAPDFEVHVFECSNVSGIADETEEMKDPTWFSVSDLPLNEMMSADSLFIERILMGKELLTGEFVHDSEWNVKSYSIKSVKELPKSTE